MIHFDGNKNCVKGRVRVLKEVILQICKDHKKPMGDLGVVFVNDVFLLNMNRVSLKHDYYTDIITFDYSGGTELEGELYISTDRVMENAKQFAVLFHVELARVIFHGVLHLIGYGDKTKNEMEVMRRMENKYIKKYLKSFHVEQNA